MCHIVVIIPSPGLNSLILNANMGPWARANNFSMWDKLKKIFTKSSLILAGKVAVSLLGMFAWHFAGYLFSWIVGPVFGFVVIVWYSKSIRDFYNWKSVVYIVIATLIWIIVASILDEPYGSTSNAQVLYGVLLGTVLLPGVHALLLGASIKRTLIAIPCIYGSFLLVLSPRIIADSHEYPNVFYDYAFPLIFLYIPVWQTAYLVSMFGFSKKKPVAAESSE